MTVDIAGAIVQVQDLQASKAFYQQILHLPITQDTPSMVEFEVTKGISLKMRPYVAKDNQEYRRGEVSPA